MKKFVSDEDLIKSNFDFMLSMDTKTNNRSVVKFNKGKEGFIEFNNYLIVEKEIKRVDETKVITNDGLIIFDNGTLNLNISDIHLP